MPNYNEPIELNTACFNLEGGTLLDRIGDVIFAAGFNWENLQKDDEGLVPLAPLATPHYTVHIGKAQSDLFNFVSERNDSAAFSGLNILVRGTCGKTSRQLVVRTGGALSDVNEIMVDTILNDTPGTVRIAHAWVLSTTWGGRYLTSLDFRGDDGSSLLITELAPKLVSAFEDNVSVPVTSLHMQLLMDARELLTTHEPDSSILDKLKNDYTFFARLADLSF